MLADQGHDNAPLGNATITAPSNSAGDLAKKRRTNALTTECQARFHDSPWVYVLMTACFGVALANPVCGFQPTDSEKIVCPVPGNRLLSPQSFRFDIPAAEPMTCPFENVVTRDEQGKQVIAKVHVKLGDNFIVMLPNGELLARKGDRVQGTEEKFVADSHDEIAAAQMNGMLRSFRYKKSRNYIYIYNTSEAFANVTKSIMESMFSGVVRHFEQRGIDTHEPDVPLVVIMFQHAQQFQNFRPMPAEVLAYYDMVANRVVLYEEFSLPGRPDLARGQLLSTIAHEGAHQILHNIGVQQRLSRWPMWLSEGIAEYLAPTSFGRNNRWKGAGKINDLRMWELEGYLQLQVTKGFNGDSVRGVVLDDQLNSTGYATAWSLVHYLAGKRKREFYELIQLISQLGPMRGMASHGEHVPENLDHFKGFFGDDIESLEQDLVAHMARQQYDSPVQNYPHFVGLVEFPDDPKPKRHACFFHSQELVDQWRRTIEASLTPEQRREAQWGVQQFLNRGLANKYIKQFLK